MFAKIFWRVMLMSKPTALAEAGMEAAFAWSAKGIAKRRVEEIIAMTEEDAKSEAKRSPISTAEVGVEAKGLGGRNVLPGIYAIV